MGRRGRWYRGSRTGPRGPYNLDYARAQWLYGKTSFEQAEVMEPVQRRNGAKGRREYDWAWVAVIPPVDEATGFHWLLIRRRITDGDLAFYRCHSPQRVALPTLVRIAGTRWAVECCFQNAKGAVGLDQHQVRRWDSWHRYTTLVMLAHAILTVIAVRERERRPAGQPGLIPLTINEIGRLFAKLVTHITRPSSFHLAWSRWRRIHQARARTSHYRSRGDTDDQPATTPPRL